MCKYFRFIPFRDSHDIDPKHELWAINLLAGDVREFAFPNPNPNLQSFDSIREQATRLGLPTLLGLGLGRSRRFLDWSRQSKAGNLCSTRFSFKLASTHTVSTSTIMNTPALFSKFWPSKRPLAGADLGKGPRRPVHPLSSLNTLLCRQYGVVNDLKFCKVFSTFETKDFHVSHPDCYTTSRGHCIISYCTYFDCNFNDMSNLLKYVPFLVVLANTF